jgi:hypothetical protein
VAAGIPDAPMIVHSEGLAGYMRYPSLYKAAGYTMVESATVVLHRGRYRAPENQFWHLRNRDKQGVNAEAGTPVALAALAAE